MHTVAIHVSNEDGGGYGGGDLRPLSRVPQVGEYVCLGVSAEWHKVLHVVHCAFEAPCVAEVYVGRAVDPDAVRTPGQGYLDLMEQKAAKVSGRTPERPAKQVWSRCILRPAKDGHVSAS